MADPKTDSAERVSGLATVAEASVPRAPDAPRVSELVKSGSELTVTESVAVLASPRRIVVAWLPNNVVVIVDPLIWLMPLLAVPSSASVTLLVPVAGSLKVRFVMALALLEVDPPVAARLTLVTPE